MFINPYRMQTKEGAFFFGKDIRVTANACFEAPVLREFWNGFCFGASDMTVERTVEKVFTVGESTEVVIGEFDYALCVTKEGVTLKGKDQTALMHGFMTLLDLIAPVNLEDGSEQFKIPCCEIYDRPALQNRMVHFCVFPETDYQFLKRFIRLCGVLKYTHIVLEFWGTLRYDCMQELSWKKAFEKEEIRPLIAEANALGLRIIPMFNHWGHASASRMAFGKHVVLDQNPRLQLCFDETGWAWDIRQPKVRALMKQIREELMELCGECEYFHIGCDEVFGSEHDLELAQAFLEHTNEIVAHLSEYGRRAIMWGDMLLLDRKTQTTDNHYYFNCKDERIESLLLNGLDRSIVIADWQYEVKTTPVETAAVFVERGFDTMLCPWDMSREAMNACLETAKQQALFGAMHTTWHTIGKGLPFVGICAKLAWEQAQEFPEGQFHRTKLAAFWRKIDPANGEYEKAGWTPNQLPPRLY